MRLDSACQNIIGRVAYLGETVPGHGQYEPRVRPIGQ
jgi:hypothetical protein